MKNIDQIVFQDILTKKGIRAGNFYLRKKGKKRFLKTIAIQKKV